MANRHFGKIADVWKHAALMEVLGRETPERYAETHAGSACYPLVRDRERAFGMLRFLDLAPRSDVLARSGYLAAVAACARADPPSYPGSPLLAMTTLRDRCSYLLCDLDPDSAASLRQQAAGLGLRQCRVAETDGMTAVAAWLGGPAGPGAGPPGPAGPGAASRAVVHIDPFDPYDRIPGGMSAIECAARLAGAGTGLVYWYGSDQPSEQAWAYHELARRTTAALWCGDVMVTDAAGGGHPGDLGRATTPGTGFGVVLANVQPATLAACAEAGAALAGAYTGVTLPDGTPGNLVFTSYPAASAEGTSRPRA